MLLIRPTGSRTAHSPNEQRPITNARPCPKTTENQRIPTEVFAKKAILTIWQRYFKNVNVALPFIWCAMGLLFLYRAFIWFLWFCLALNSHRSPSRSPAARLLPAASHFDSFATRPPMHRSPAHSAEARLTPASPHFASSLRMGKG